MAKGMIRVSGAIFFLMFSFPCTQSLTAQNNVGGHFGISMPLLSISEGEFSSVADNVIVGFPTGISIRLRPDTAFDVEIVPFVDENAVSNVLVHPGILIGVTNGFTFGLRGAFETSGSFGATPLLQRSFAFPNDQNTRFFAEAALPVRFYQAPPEYQGAAVSVSKTLSLAVNLGISF